MYIGKIRRYVGLKRSWCDGAGAKVMTYAHSPFPLTIPHSCTWANGRATDIDHAAFYRNTVAYLEELHGIRQEDAAKESYLKQTLLGSRCHPTLQTRRVSDAHTSSGAVISKFKSGAPA